MSSCGSSFSCSSSFAFSGSVSSKLNGKMLAIEEPWMSPRALMAHSSRSEARLETVWRDLLASVDALGADRRRRCRPPGGRPWPPWPELCAGSGASR